MKNEVIKFLADKSGDKHTRFSKGFSLYREAPMKNPSIERSYNLQGCTNESLKSLEYDLRQAYDIKDREIHEFIFNQQTDNQIINTEGLTAEESATDLNKEGTQLGVIISDLGNTLNIETTGNHVLGVEAVTDEKEQFSLREKYPFLKDEDCPAELKILIADKITAWGNYAAARNQLQLVLDGELTEADVDQTKLAAQADENYAKNEAITKELDHYLAHQELLGEHPIFAKLQLEREVEEMTNEELVKFKQSSIKYFSDNRKKLEKATAENNQINIDKINNAIARREVKLKLVNKRLGINE